MDKRVINSQNELSAILQRTRDIIKNGDFDEARTELENGLSIDFNNTEVITGLKYINFWIERKSKFHNVSGHFERGMYLFKQWEKFQEFIQKYSLKDEMTLYALKYWVFSQALYHFLEILNHSPDDYEMLIKIGISYKNLGDYCKALEYLEYAGQKKNDDAELLSEMADCYALINEVRAAKIFFREAFFIDPSKINLYSMESLLIAKLIENIRSQGYEKTELNEWIPVYGVLYGVFNIKRELKALELGKLKQSIHALENRYEEEPENRYITIPRLLNRYFWLIDYYINVKDSRDRIEDILKKINKLNPSVYELYTN